MVSELWCNLQGRDVNSWGLGFTLVWPNVVLVLEALHVPRPEQVSDQLEVVELLVAVLAQHLCQLGHLSF